MISIKSFRRLVPGKGGREMSEETDRIEKRIEELRRELSFEQDRLAVQHNIEFANERVYRVVPSQRPQQWAVFNQTRPTDF